MLWSPWEAVPECSPQIQAWDYLGGYYIRCRGNFRDSNFQNHLASAGPDYLLPLLTTNSFIHGSAESRNPQLIFSAGRAIFRSLLWLKDLIPATARGRKNRE